MGFGSIGSVWIDVKADTAHLVAGFTRAENMIKRSAERMIQITGTIGVAYSALSIKGFIDESAKATAEQKAFAQQLAVSVETLTKWEYIASKAHVSIDQLRDAFKDAGTKVTEFQREGESAKEAFQALGISQDFAKKNMYTTEKSMEILLQRLAKFPDGMQKATIAQEIFGDEGANVIRVANLGADAIKRYTEEAVKGNIVTSEAFAQKNALYLESQQRLEALQGGWANAMIEESHFLELGTYMYEELGNSIMNWTEDVQSGNNSFIDGLDSIATGVYAVFPTVIEIGGEVTDSFMIVGGAVVTVGNVVLDLVGVLFGFDDTANQNITTLGHFAGLTMGASMALENFAHLVEFGANGVEMFGVAIETYAISRLQFLQSKFYSSIGAIKEFLNVISFGELGEDFENYKAKAEEYNVSIEETLVKGNNKLYDLKKEQDKIIKSFYSAEMIEAKMQQTAYAVSVRQREGFKKIKLDLPDYEKQGKASVKALEATMKALEDAENKTKRNTKVTQAHTKAIKNQATAYNKLQNELKRFEEAYNRTTLSTYEYQLKKLNEEKTHYAQIGVDKLKLAQWYNSEIEKLEKARVTKQIDLEKQALEIKRLSLQLSTGEEDRVGSLEDDISILKERLSITKDTKEQQALTIQILQAQISKNEELKRIEEEQRKKQEEEKKKQIDAFIEMETIAYRQRIEAFKRELEERERLQKEYQEKMEAIGETLSKAFEVGDWGDFDGLRGELEKITREGFEKGFTNIDYTELGVSIASVVGNAIGDAVNDSSSKGKFQQEVSATGGAIGGGIGEYFGGEAGKIIGTAIGTALGNAISGKGKYSKYFVRDDRTIDEYDRNDRGIFGHSSKLDEEASRQFTKQYQELIASYKEIAQALGDSQFETYGRIAIDKQYDFNDILRDLDESLYDSVTGYSEVLVGIAQEYGLSNEQARQLNELVISGKNTNLVRAEDLATLQEAKQKSMELQQAWELYAQATDMGVTEYMANAIDAVNQQVQQVEEYTRKDDFVALYEYQHGLLEETRENLENTVGMGEVTLDNYNEIWNEIKANSDTFTPEAVSAFSQLGGVLVQSANLTDNFSASLASMQQSLNSASASLSEYIATRGKVGAELAEIQLGFVQEEYETALSAVGLAASTTIEDIQGAYETARANAEASDGAIIGRMVNGVYTESVGSLNAWTASTAESWTNLMNTAIELGRAEDSLTNAREQATASTSSSASAMSSSASAVSSSSDSYADTLKETKERVETATKALQDFSDWYYDDLDELGKAKKKIAELNELQASQLAELGLSLINATSYIEKFQNAIDSVDTYEIWNPKIYKEYGIAIEDVQDAIHTYSLVAQDEADLLDNLNVHFATSFDDISMFTGAVAGLGETADSYLGKWEELGDTIQELTEAQEAYNELLIQSQENLAEFSNWYGGISGTELEQLRNSISVYGDIVGSLIENNNTLVMRNSSPEEFEFQYNRAIEHEFPVDENIEAWEELGEAIQSLTDAQIEYENILLEQQNILNDYEDDFRLFGLDGLALLSEQVEIANERLEFIASENDFGTSISNMEDFITAYQNAIENEFLSSPSIEAWEELGEAIQEVENSTKSFTNALYEEIEAEKQAYIDSLLTTYSRLFLYQDELQALEEKRFKIDEANAQAILDANEKRYQDELDYIERINEATTEMYAKAIDSIDDAIQKITNIDDVSSESMYLNLISYNTEVAKLQELIRNDTVDENTFNDSLSTVLKYVDNITKQDIYNKDVKNSIVVDLETLRYEFEHPEELAKVIIVADESDYGVEMQSLSEDELGRIVELNSVIDYLNSIVAQDDTMFAIDRTIVDNFAITNNLSSQQYAELLQITEDGIITNEELANIKYLSDDQIDHLRDINDTLENGSFTVDFSELLVNDYSYEQWQELKEIAEDGIITNEELANIKYLTSDQINHLRDIDNYGATDSTLTNFSKQNADNIKAIEYYARDLYSANGDMLANIKFIAYTQGAWLTSQDKEPPSSYKFTSTAYPWYYALQDLGFFADGGYTGGSDPSKIAGFVHEQEYVIPAQGVPVVREKNNNSSSLLQQVVTELKENNRKLERIEAKNSELIKINAQLVVENRRLQEAVLEA